MAERNDKRSSTSLYILKTMNFKSDILYKVYIKENIIYGAKIAGQIFDKESATFQLLFFSILPWIKNKIKKRYELEHQYDNSELNVDNFLIQNKDNFIIHTSDIKEIIFDSRWRLWTGSYPNKGTLKIETRQKGIMKFIIIGKQDIDSIKKIFSDLGILIKLQPVS